MPPLLSPQALATEAVFHAYQQPSHAIDRFLETIGNDSMPFEDIYEVFYELSRGSRQSAHLLFAGQESVAVIRPVMHLAEMHLTEPEELYAQRVTFFRKKHADHYDELLAQTLKPQYVEKLKHFICEARGAIQRAVEFCHAPTRVESLELIPGTPLSWMIEDQETREKIFLSCNNYDISIGVERMMEDSCWRTVKTVHHSECKTHAGFDLSTISPSQSGFAKEQLSKVRGTFVLRNIHECPWKKDWDDDGFAINYPQDCTVPCLVIEGQLPLMSRREIHLKGFQHPVFPNQ